MAIVDGELTDPERDVRDAVKSGMLVNFHSGQPRLDDPAQGLAWGEERTVRARVLRDLLLAADARALRLQGARITGVLDLEAASLTYPLMFRDCHFEHPFNVMEAHLPALHLRGCHVPGFNAQRLTVDGNLELSEGFTSQGEVRLMGANVKGILDCSRASLINPDGCALNGDRLTVDQNVLCGPAFVTQGEVRLSGAHIGGQLNLNGATLINPNGWALNGDRLTVDQNVLCGPAFVTQGEVRLSGAHIGGQLNLNGATLVNPNGHVLSARRLIVDQSMLCGEQFKAEGEVWLSGAHIEERLDFNDATLMNPDGMALTLSDVRVESLLLRLRDSPKGGFDFTDARVNLLADHEATWPSKLATNGFVYDTIAEYPPISARRRLGWLARDVEGFRPQSYDQLIAVYRKAGRHRDARIIAIARERHRRDTLSRPGRVWSLLLDTTVGYGHRTWLAGVWLFEFVVLGWWIFDRAYPAYLVPVKPIGERPPFHAGLYSLDLLLPIINLGYQDAWAAREWARYFWLTWILAGWLLTTAVIAALAGFLDRRD